jgi:hypothetical protein
MRKAKMASERADRAKERHRKVSEAFERSHRAVINAKAEELLQRDEAYGALLSQEAELRKAIHQNRANLSKKLLKLRRLARDLQRLGDDITSANALVTGTVRQFIGVKAEVAAKASDARVRAASGLGR